MSQRPWRIVIIDDNPEDREAYRRYLTQDAQHAYLFAEADSAESGALLCGTFAPDCVLLDYRLPQADGLDLLHTYEEGASPPSFAVVMLTGQGDEAVAVEALKTGAQDYLVKSRLTPEGLRGAVHRAIAEVQRRREQAARQAELERQVTTDGLTGLLNRIHFLERLEKELWRSQRYGGTLALLMIDVDHFKRVNDAHGHLVGDHVLVQIGKALRSCLRSSDLAARYGGEEFCILAANTDLEGGRAFGERVRQLVAQQQLSSGRDDVPLAVTCSIGVAQGDGATASARELIARADAALYRAKDQGRDQVCLAE